MLAVVPFFKEITSWFGPRDKPAPGASSDHKGIDISAEGGSPVCAAMTGKIIRQETQRGYGNVIYVEHPDGTQTRYAHLEGFAKKKGDVVQAGEQIGFVGSTGISTGNHLHFEWRDPNGVPLDPWPLLSGNAVASPANYQFASQYRQPQSIGTQSTVANSAATQHAMNEMVSFEYAKQVAYREKVAKESEGTGINWRKGGWLFMLVGALIDGIPEEKTEEKTQTRMASTQINVSKAEMEKMGFTPHEINTLSLVSSMQKGAQENGANQGMATLRQNGKALTEVDLTKMGFSAEKIQMLNDLYDHNSQQA